MPASVHCPGSPATAIPCSHPAPWGEGGHVRTRRTRSLSGIPTLPSLRTGFGFHKNTSTRTVSGVETETECFALEKDTRNVSGKMLTENTKERLRMFPEVVLNLWAVAESPEECGTNEGTRPHPVSMARGSVHSTLSRIYSDSDTLPGENYCSRSGIALTASKPPSKPLCPQDL